MSVTLLILNHYDIIRNMFNNMFTTEFLLLHCDFSRDGVFKK